MISRRLIMWVLLGFPIYAINYGLFLVVFWALGSSSMAYWSWPLAAPLTLRMWDYLEVRSRKEPLQEGYHNSVQMAPEISAPRQDRT